MPKQLQKVWEQEPHLNLKYKGTKNFSSTVAFKNIVLHLPYMSVNICMSETFQEATTCHLLHCNFQGHTKPPNLHSVPEVTNLQLILHLWKRQI
jgi:hypothetical protein